MRWLVAPYAWPSRAWLLLGRSTVGLQRQPRHSPGLERRYWRPADRSLAGRRVEAGGLERGEAAVQPVVAAVALAVAPPNGERARRRRDETADELLERSSCRLVMECATLYVQCGFGCAHAHPGTEGRL